MKELFIIAGHSSQGKSGVIRCLSGKNRRGQWRINNGTNDDLFYVCPPALQEINRSPAEFLNDIARYNYALFTLKIDPERDQPNGQEYLDFFSAHGCNIAGLAVLGQLENPFSHNALVIPENCWAVGSNRLAATVRNHWGWI